MRAAGFVDVRVSSSTWEFGDPQTRAWWGGLWAERASESAFAAQAVRYGVADRATLDDIAAAFRDWADDPDGMFVVPHVEVLATVAE